LPTSTSFTIKIGIDNSTVPLPVSLKMLTKPMMRNCKFNKRTQYPVDRQFYRLSAEQITTRLPAPPITNEYNYEKTFALKLFASHYHFNTSDQIYMTNKT
jgi:hypothetical protein